MQALDEIKFQSGFTTEAILVEQDRLPQMIAKTMTTRDAPMVDLSDSDLDDLEISGGDDQAGDAGDLEVDDTPVVRFINKVLLDAINRGASEIHLDPYE